MEGSVARERVCADPPRSSMSASTGTLHTHACSPKLRRAGVRHPSCARASVLPSLRCARVPAHTDVQCSSMPCLTPPHGVRGHRPVLTCCASACWRACAPHVMRRTWNNFEKSSISAYPRKCIEPWFSGVHILLEHIVWGGSVAGPQRIPWQDYHRLRGSEKERRQQSNILAVHGCGGEAASGMLARLPAGQPPRR